MPGLFSLLAAPLILIYNLVPALEKNNLRVMELNMPNSKPEFSSIGFSISSIPLDRNRVVFTLNEHAETNRKVLHDFEHTVLTAQEQNDTSIVIQLHFDSTTSYQWFIETLNLLDRVNAKCYAYFDFNMYVYEIPKHGTEINFQPSFGPCIIYDNPTSIELLKRQFYEIPFFAWQILGAYIVFILIYLFHRRIKPH
jgi:hypothetical protein